MTVEHLITRVGAAAWGDNRFRGNSVNEDLAGRVSHWQLLALAVGHDSLPPEDAPLLDDLVVCCIAPDPRIWPLKIVRLLSAFGHPTAGTIAGTYSTEGSPFGWRSCASSAEFLVAVAEAHRSRDLSGALQDSHSGPYPGYGVPFREEDERVVALRKCVEQRDRPGDFYWKLAHKIEGEATAPPLNIGGASGALLLDRGFSPKQILGVGPILAHPNYLANAMEGAEQAPAVLRELPADAIDDQTAPKRRSPRAVEADRRRVSANPDSR